MSPSRVTASGVAYAVAAYGWWGLAPIFWKQLGSVPALEVLAHRVVWGMVVLLLLLAWRRRLGELLTALATPRTLAPFLVSAVLISANWFLYIWAIYSEQILQASLGYFVNPLFNVLLGMLFLGERLRPLQWLAVILAGLGVGQLALQAETFPWIALALVVSFGFYGLARKTAPADALLGSNLEVAFVVPLALAYLLWLLRRGEAAFTAAEAPTLVLLAATGLITALPLLWFSNAARRLPLATLGFVQYLAPTGQFLLAVLVYDEPFTSLQLRAFVTIWLALAIFSFEAHLQYRRRCAEARVRL